MGPAYGSRFGHYLGNRIDANVGHEANHKFQFLVGGDGLRFWRHERQNADLHQERQQNAASSPPAVAQPLLPLRACEILQRPEKWIVVLTNQGANIVTEIPLGLSLDETEVGFILRRKNSVSAIISMPISREELFGLQETITSWTDRMVSGVKTQSSVEAIVFQPVAEFDLAHEAIGEHLLLTLVAPSGNRRTFGLPPRMAADLAANIPTYLDEMSGEDQRRQ